jgi:hypothetical protein
MNYDFISLTEGFGHRIIGEEAKQVQVCENSIDLQSFEIGVLIYMIYFGGGCIILNY